MRIPFTRRPIFATEVIQTSAMDCGPAALKCVLEGFGVGASYGRLREVCHTDVDGTSIDALEDLAKRLGLDAEQIMIPADHLLLREASALPAILVVTRPGGVTHFVVVWRRIGGLVQVMDPAIGRRWMRGRTLLDEAYTHEHVVTAADWHEWARSDDFLRPLGRRLAQIGGARKARALLLNCAANTDWRQLAAFDAALRMTADLVDEGGVRRGGEAARLLEDLVARSLGLWRDSTVHQLSGPPPTAVEPAPGGLPRLIPEVYWSVRPAAPGGDGLERLSLKGAVLVRFRGTAPAGAAVTAASEEVRERGASPLVEYWRALPRRSWLSLAAVGSGIALAAAGVVFEGLLVRALLDLGREIRLVEQRLTGMGLVVAFVAALLLVELQMVRGLARLGRLAEINLRVKFLRKIPLLGDRYFRSRPASDMAERAHAAHQCRLLPELLGEMSRRGFALLITALAIGLVFPGTAPVLFLAVISAVALPWAFKGRLEEHDLRVRTHAGALSRFYLDALLGLTAVRAHSAEGAVRREHEGLLIEWARATSRLVRCVTTLEFVTGTCGFGFAIWLIAAHLGASTDAGGALLLAYWALQLPVLGSELALLVAQYPLQRNTLLRLFEPMGAPEEEAPASAEPEPPGGGPPRIELRNVSVIAAGQPILHDLSLTIGGGEHLAIVGRSGAGKSSLAGLFLGWLRPASGELLCDGAALDHKRLASLRRACVWVDPSIWLWNRSLFDNLAYGNETSGGASIAGALDQSGLYSVLDTLPAGLQSSLGEGGAFLSAGEGQRVRFGRGVLRARPRLVILDEPFRGLDQSQRAGLLRQARELWAGATLVCITHDMAETSSFDRVVVMDGGTIVEDGPPRELAARSDSRYRAMLDAAHSARSLIWDDPLWRRVRLEEGRIHEAEGASP
jgi:ATP-binding cassette subfamily B protein